MNVCMYVCMYLYIYIAVSFVLEYTYYVLPLKRLFGAICSESPFHPGDFSLPRSAFSDGVHTLQRAERRNGPASRSKGKTHTPYRMIIRVRGTMISSRTTSEPPPASMRGSLLCALLISRSSCLDDSASAVKIGISRV